MTATAASVVCVVLLGPPGSGKGTQAKRLVGRHQGWVHVSTGDLFRAEISSGSGLGVSVKATIDAGNLVSDETTNEVFASQLDKILKSKPQTKVLLLDGYPRTRPQAQALVALTKRRPDLADIKIVEFVASEELLVERLSGRRINPKTGRIYHLVSNPPTVPGRCDDDGTELVQRADDKPETIRSRYRLYVKERDGIVKGLVEGGFESPVAIEAGLAPDLVEAKLETTIASILD
ncbi:MAG TPA: nucleoside monophosphate kinase [Bdellovibrionota bacterium]|jgi:adenylate kinase|nr:nucleoside monophosphate kinase [Bdellovibrionota bacterium]